MFGAMVLPLHCNRKDNDNKKGSAEKTPVNTKGLKL